MTRREDYLEKVEWFRIYVANISTFQSPPIIYNTLQMVAGVLDRKALVFHEYVTKLLIY